MSEDGILSLIKDNDGLDQVVRRLYWGLIDAGLPHKLVMAIATGEADAAFEMPVTANTGRVIELEPKE